MPDGPRYDDDFYAWTQYQAEILRSMPSTDNRFDRENVAEEIEDLGKSVRSAVRSQVRRILEHFLKLAYSPATQARADWRASIVSARDSLEDDITPTLRRDLEALLPRLYARARKVARSDLERYGEGNVAARFPAECPYTLEQVFADDWFAEFVGDVT